RPPRHSRSPLFPYTTLFRSSRWRLFVQASAISYQLSAAGTLCIAQCLDLVMVALHALELALDHHADIGRQVFVERLAIALQGHIDRKSTRLNSSHVKISYAV